MCLWDNLGNSTDLHWEASIGQDAFWKGGPRLDKTDGSLDGGYAFFETSTMPETIATNSVSAMMESPLLSSTGSQVRQNDSPADKIMALMPCSRSQNRFKTLMSSGCFYRSFL